MSLRPVVLSLGSINADFQVRVDAMDDFGSSLRPARDLARLSGGKAANVAVLARRLGCEAHLLGRVGADEVAEQALAPLRAEGVDVGAVRHAAGEKTGMAFLATGPDGSKRSISAPEANFGFDDRDLEAAEAAVQSAPAGAVLVADYEVTAGAVSRAIAAARARGLTIIVDPSYPHLVRREDLCGVTVLTPNEREARLLAGVGDAVPLGKVARALAKLGPQSICIKLNGGGCLLMHEGQLWHQHAARVDVVDTSGAGDASTGAIAAGLAEGQSLRKAVLLATVAAELAVSGYGAQPSYPDRVRLEDQLTHGGERPLRAWTD